MFKIRSNYQIIFFSLMIFSLSLFTIQGSFAASYYGDSPYLRVITEEITPEPVEPGQDLTVKIRVVNDGGDSAKDVSLKLDTTYPFYVKTDSNAFSENRTLCAGCSMDNTYYLVVDSNAKSGVYPLSVKLFRDGTSMQPTDTVNIKIIGKPDIVLETKNMNLNVSSGDQLSIEYALKNIGTGIAKNIKILPESDNFVMMGSNIDLIKSIQPGEEVSFKLNFVIKETLKPDTYKFPINIQYIDEQGTNYNNDFNIGVNVLNKADLDFQSIKITPTNPTILDPVHMEGIVENTGTGDADKVTIELATPNGVIHKAFVGQLKADDDAPFYFDVNPKETGLQKGILKISYYDDFGFHSYNISLTKEIKKPTNNLIKIISGIFIGIVVVGYTLIKKKKKKTQKK